MADENSVRGESETTRKANDQLLEDFAKKQKRVFKLNENHPHKRVYIERAGRRILLRVEDDSNIYEVDKANIDEETYKILVSRIEDADSMDHKLSILPEIQSEKQESTSGNEVAVCVDKQTQTEMCERDKKTTDITTLLKELKVEFAYVKQHTTQSVYQMRKDQVLFQNETDTEIKKNREVMESMRMEIKSELQSLKELMLQYMVYDGEEEENCQAAAASVTTGNEATYSKIINDRNPTTEKTTNVMSKVSLQTNSQTTANKEERVEILDMSEAIRNELKRLGYTENKNTDKIKTVDNEKISIEIVNKGNDVKRDYKLTLKTKMEHFMDHFTSELRSHGLLYLIDPKYKPSTELNDEKIENDKFKVRSILITRLDPTYHSKVSEIQDPVAMLNKIKILKLAETNVTTASIKKQLYSIMYNPSKESASEFWNRFEDIVRSHDNIQNVTPLSESEKRDAFYNAVKTSVPQVQSVEFVTKNTRKTGMTYDELKNCIVQVEAERGGVTPKTVSANFAKKTTRQEDNEPRCYKCGDIGHVKYDCKAKDGEFKCYHCNKFGNHLSKDCPERGKRYAFKRNFEGKRINNSGRGQKRQYDRNETNNERDKMRPKFEKGRSEKFLKNRKSYKDIRQNNHEKEDKENKKGKRNNLYFNNCVSLNNTDVLCTDTINERRIFTKFLADSGATEHLTNSRVIFTSFDDRKRSYIKGANNNPSAMLKTEGEGSIDVYTSEGKKLNLEKVICSEALTENLLSLRKFTDMGLSVYLDNKIIDIYDPRSKESFVSGIYQSPYWMIEFETNIEKELNKECKRPSLVAYLSTTGEDIPRYITRSVTAQNTTDEIEKSVLSNETAKESDSPVQDVSSKLKINTSDNIETTENKEISDVTTESEKSIKENFTEETCNFDTSIWDRVIHKTNESTENFELEEVPKDLDPFAQNKNEKYQKNNYALLWHVRMGHASIAYLKALQKQFPNIKGLREAVFDESICIFVITSDYK